MIRPFTCVCFLLACGSGLYLYQAKHRVQMIDREIEKIVRATSELREQTRVLHAEWTLQSDPQRLQALSDQLPQPEDRHARPVHQHGRSGRPAARGARPPEPPPSEPLTVPIADGSAARGAGAHPAACRRSPPPWRSPPAPPPRPPEHKPPPPRPVDRRGSQPVRAAADRRASGGRSPSSRGRSSPQRTAPAACAVSADGRFRARDGAERLAAAAAADAGQRLAMGHPTREAARP